MFQKSALISLIRRLNKAEVRHFALVSKIYEKSAGKVYYKLFSSLRRQTLNNNEDAAIEKTINNSTIEKYHLFTRLTESLLEFHKKNNVHFSILNSIKLMRIFYDKGMAGEALHLGERTKKTCYEYELYEYIIVIINQQFRLIENHQVQKAESIRAGLVEEYDSVLKINAQIFKLEQARLNLLQLFNSKGLPVTKEDVGAFSLLLIPLAGMELSSSVLIRSKYYRFINSYYHVLNDFECAEEYQSLHYRLFETNPQFRESNILEYVLFLYYYIENLLYLKQYTKANKLISELKKTGVRYGKKDVVIKEEIESRLVPLEVYYLLCLKDYKGIVANESSYRNFVEKYKGRLRSFRMYSFIYNLSQAYLMTNNFSKIIRLLGTSDLIRETSEKIALFYILRLIHIIALLEMKQNETAQSILASLARHLKQKKGTTCCLEIKLLKLVELRYLKIGKRPDLQEEDISHIKAFLKDHPFLHQWMEKTLQEISVSVPEYSEY